MITFTATIDKGTRVIIAVAILCFFSKYYIDLGKSLYTFDLFIITAICIVLPFLESLTAWIVFLLIASSNLFGVSLSSIPGGTTYNFELLSAILKYCLIIPIITFGVVKRYRFTQNYYTDTLLGLVISWILYVIFVATAYSIKNTNIATEFLPILRHTFTQNIFIYIFNASILIVVLPIVWKKVDGKRKKIRTLSIDE